MEPIDSRERPSDIYARLRNQALSLDPAQLGLKLGPTDPIFGLLMETGIEDAAVMLAAIGDGSVSLYFSNGGGIIGLGQHDGPRQACFALLTCAQQFTSEFHPSRQYPLPETGYVTFYLLTLNGILTTSAKEADLGKSRHPLSPLFRAAHDVITQARLVDEKRRARIRDFVGAATTGDVDKINDLVGKGIDPNASDPTGLTALMAASYSGRVETAALLIEKGAQVDKKDSEGYTALMFACNSGQLPCARLLIERGANVNEVDHDGSTPIMFCAQHGHNDLVRLLMDKGADPRARGNHGLSAIGFAEQNGFTETKRILEGMP